MNNINENKLIDFLKGTLSAKETAEVEKWYAADEDNAALLEQLSDAMMLRRSLETMYRGDAKRSYAEFSRRVADKEARLSLQRRLSRKRRLSKVAVAAVFVAAVALSAVAGIYFTGRVENTVIVRTNIGERTQVELPDGSRVWLNACSEIKYGSSVFGGERKIALVGEAYFEVEKNSKPFVVDCDGMNIEVLGTKFNVMANPDDRMLTATLMEGSIQVTSPFIRRRDGLRMKPQDQLMINKTSGNATISKSTGGNHSVSWINGKLSFNGSTFEQIARTLERNYNIDIVFKDDRIRQRKFTCDFSTYDNIYRIMSILGLTEKFDYRVDGRRIEIESR